MPAAPGFTYLPQPYAAQQSATSNPWNVVSASTGPGDAEYQLGQQCRAGSPDGEDYLRALGHYLKAAQAGNAEAMCMAGNIYLMGLGTPKDNSQAMYWLRAGAALDNPGSINNLGYMYKYGDGVPQDYNQAASYFRHAADLGLPDAENNIGLSCVAGLGIPQDYVQARYWFEKAKAGGCDKAVKNLEKLTASGH